MSGIFISYRREDSAAVAGRLFDDLSRRFGKKNVFRDIDAIDPGAEFARVITERIGACDVLIALIGKNWLDTRDVEGRRRLEQPRDFVTAEIAEALVQEKLVIPALIEGASMPAREELPARIASLAERHAIAISDAHFKDDARKLTAVIRAEIARRAQPGEAPRLIRREQNQRDLLDDVKREIADRLAQSLHNEVLINLLKTRQPHQLQRPWDVEIKIGRQQSAPLPPQTQIVEVFVQEAVAGKLLILGAPERARPRPYCNSPKN